MAFMPVEQIPFRNASLVIRTSGDPNSFVESVRSEILRLDPQLPVYQARSMKDHMSEQQGGNSIMAKIMAVLALVALVLAVVGVYGVMAYSVSQRTQEMGIRMALGAQPRAVLIMVIRQGAMLALAGVVIGTGIALVVTRGLATFLFGVSPFDLTAFGGVAATLLLSGLGATVLPAHRATQVDPVEALRYE